MPRTLPLSSLLDTLEQRQLLAGFQDFNDPDDGDVFRAELTGPGSIVVSAGARTIDLSGTQTSSTLTVTRITPGGNGRLNWNRIESAGSMNSISAATVDINAGVNARIRVGGSAKSITFGDMLAADLTVQTPGVIATNVRARFVDTSSMHLGRVGSMDVDNLIGGVVIQADRFNTFVVRNVTGSGGQVGIGAKFDLDLSGATPYSIRTMRIEGDLIGGTWNLNGPVQSIDINNAVSQIGFPLVVTINGRLGSLKGGRLHGIWSAHSFGVIASEDVLIGQYTSTVGGFDSIRADEFSPRLIAAAGQGIKSLVAGAELNTSITADYVDSLLATGGAANLTMDLLGVTIRPYQLKTMTIASVLHGHININGNVHTISLGGAESLFLNVGATPPAFEGFITSAAQVAAGKGNVQVLRIKAAPGDPESFSTSVFNVRRFGTVITTARTNVFIPLSLFGFRFVESPGAVNIRLSVPGLVDQFITNPATNLFPPLFQFTYERVV